MGAETQQSTKGDSIIVVDTSSSRTTVVCAEGDAILFEESRPGDKHLEVLAPLVREALGTLPRNTNKPSALAVVVGPGGFSGLRVGVSFMSVLAHALDLTAVPLDALVVLARSVPDEPRTVLVANDGKRSEVFYALCARCEGGDLEIETEGHCRPEDLATQLRRIERRDLFEEEVVVVGSGLTRYRELLEIPDEWRTILDESQVTSAEALVSSARSQYIRGDGVRGVELSVNYLRAPDARPNVSAVVGTLRGEKGARR